MEAVIKSERCSACGICVGSCDFSAVNLPAMTDTMIKDKMDRLLSSIPEGIKRPKILGLTCEHSIRVDKDMPNVKTISFPCIGMVHPLIIEYGFNSGADGIFICGCVNGDCHYRKGNTWLQSRLEGKRPPVLSRSVDHNRIMEYWLSSIHADRLMEGIELFERKLIAYEDENPPFPPLVKRGEGRFGVKKGILKRVMASVSILFLSAFLILYLSERPIYPFYNKDMSLIKFTFKHPGRHKSEQRELTEKETENMLRHMRRTNSPFLQMRMVGKRERLPVYVEVELNDKMILAKTYYPAGLKNDIPAFAYEEFPVLPGTHHIEVRVRDSKREEGFDYTFEKKIETEPGKVTVVDLGIYK
jgi:coenzyme F420-reducing hydrogenase delta subunit